MSSSSTKQKKAQEPRTLNGTVITAQMWKELLNLPFSPLDPIGPHNPSIGAHILKSLRAHLTKGKQPGCRALSTHILQEFPAWMAKNRGRKEPEDVTYDNEMLQGKLSADLMAAMLRFAQGQAVDQDDPYDTREKAKKKAREEKKVKVVTNTIPKPAPTPSNEKTAKPTADKQDGQEKRKLATSDKEGSAKKKLKEDVKSLLDDFEEEPKKVPKVKAPPKDESDESDGSDE